MIDKGTVTTAIAAIVHFGEDHQLEKLREELIELHQALTYYKKYPGDTERELAVIDELADVIITVTQGALIFGEQAVTERIKVKVNRLRGIIAGEK